MSDLLRYPDHTHNDESIDGCTIELCENCVMAEAGYDPWEGRERDEREYDTCPEWHGWSFCSKYAEDDPEMYYEPMMHEFSKSQCDGCHTTLAGTRYIHTAIHWSCPEDDRQAEEADLQRKDRT